MDSRNKQTAKQQQSNKVATQNSRRRRNKTKMVMSTKSQPVTLKTPGYSNSGALSRPQLSSIMRNPRLTKPGMDFLKCAFAPPDFNGDSSSGVPDGFTGKTLVKKHKSVRPVSFQSGLDYYILVAPVPGVAYSILSKPAGTAPVSADFYQSVSYSDSFQLFGGSAGSTASDVVTAFRTVSLCAELVPTTNAMTWSGSIQSFKIPLVESTNYDGVVSGTAGVQYVLSGLESVNSTIASQYSAPFNLGVYAFSGNMDPEFTFRPIREGISKIPANAGPSSFGGFLAGAAPYTGMGQAETILFKISGVTSTNTALLKTWSCVEYKVNSNASLYEYTSVSPAEDRLALECYRQILMSTPPGVSYFDNAGIWERILAIIRTVSGIASYAPGPYGLMGKGVNMTAEALSALTL